MEQSGRNHSIAGHESWEPDRRIAEEIMASATPLIKWFIVAVGTVGAIGNILNIVVFTRLGFSKTIHMSYVALAASDLFVILSIVWTTVSYYTLPNALLRDYGLHLDKIEIPNITGKWPHMGFSRTRALITAWISLERCLCVLLPTRVKVIINRNVTRAVLVTIFVVGCCPVVLIFIDLNIEWVPDLSTNVSTLRMYYDFEKKENIFNSIAILLYGAIYPVSSWLVVSMCTTLLIIRLRQTARWRQLNAAVTSTRATSAAAQDVPQNTQNSAFNFKRENRVTKTVILIAGFFVLFSLPISLNILMALIFREEYSIYSPLKFLFAFNASIALILSEINSSVNIIFYVTTGDKFRSTLLQLVFLRCLQK